jgi:hypothetical protein
MKEESMKTDYAKGGSPYVLNTEEVKVIDSFDREDPEGAVFKHNLVKAINPDSEYYYNHKVYNPFKKSTEFLGQFRDKEEAVDSFNSWKSKEHLNSQGYKNQFFIRQQIDANNELSYYIVDWRNDKFYTGYKSEAEAKKYINHNL